jgi:hypothetical protein
VGKGCRRWIWCKYCEHTNINGTKIPVETIPQRGGVGKMESGGQGDLKSDIFAIL